MSASKINDLFGKPLSVVNIGLSSMAESTWVPSLAITGAVRIRDAMRRARGGDKTSVEG